MKTSEILKDLRKSKKMTQADLAKALKIGQATVAGYENEEYIPHISSLIAYANFFECSIDYLVGREDDFGNITVQAESNAPVLSAEERELLENFRAVDLRNKDRISVYARIRREEYEESKGKRHS